MIHNFYVTLLLAVSTKIVAGFSLSSNRIPSLSTSSTSLKSSSQHDIDRKIPKAIIFDLDGLIWTPEMYEINFFQNGRGSPFSVNPNDPLNLLTCGRRPVSLLGDSRSIFRDLFTDERFQHVKVGISSRTDEPEWARELLTKFPIPLSDEGINGECTTLDIVFNGPIEIAKDEKVDHFARIAESCNIDFEDILFFDNEYRNCQSVAQLGVSVVYCPDGVTRDLWNIGLFEDFPRSDGTVINVDFAL